ncbi:MAG: hypothetical protein IJS58_05390 [Bacilli bacterium]|nr:hypothetical protein [Bacilli bacterium]
MADEVKRKRGRPKKVDTPTPIANEEKEQTIMSANKPTYQEIKEGVGTVKSVPQNITLDAIQARWRNVFGKYATLGFDSIMEKWSTSNNPYLSNPFIQNERVKKISSPALKVGKDTLQDAMSNPLAHESTLRSFSMYLYYNNFIYQTLIRLNRDTPMYNYYYYPLYDVDKKEDIKKESALIDKALKEFDVKLTLKTMASQVYQEGKCSYLTRLSFNKDKVNYFHPQKLDSEQIKVVGFGTKQQFIISFNMVIFLDPAYDTKLYPKFIQDTWDEMNKLGIISTDKKGKLKLNPKANLPANHMLEFDSNGKYMYWVRLPQDMCYTFYSDGSHPNVFPDTIGLFNDLNDLDDYRWLQGNLLSKGVNSVLTAEVPLVKDPKAGGDSTAISPDTVLGFQDFFAQNISANIFPFFAPFTKFDLHTLENQPESMNIIYSRIRDLIATSGNSALLPITDKPSIASVKAAESIQASKNDYLTRQFETYLNHVINESLGLKYKWHVSLWGDIFYWRDDAKMMKDFIANGGMTGLLPRLLSANDQTLEDYKGAKLYLDILEIELDNKNPNEEANPVGRPKLNDNDIENDNTGTSNDLGNNVSEIKLSANTNIRYCCKCHSELQDHEDILCDNCLEEAYNERLSDT